MTLRDTGRIAFHESKAHKRINRRATSDRQTASRGETRKTGTQAGSQDTQATGAIETQLKSIGETRMTTFIIAMLIATLITARKIAKLKHD